MHETQVAAGETQFGPETAGSASTCSLVVRQLDVHATTGFSMRRASSSRTVSRCSIDSSCSSDLRPEIVIMARAAASTLIV